MNRLSITIGIVIWIVGIITAYPKSKRWRMEAKNGRGHGKTWTRRDAIETIISMSMFWWISWADYISKKLEGWLDKPSKI